MAYQHSIRMRPRRAGPLIRVVAGIGRKTEPAPSLELLRGVVPSLYTACNG